MPRIAILLLLLACAPSVADQDTATVAAECDIPGRDTGDQGAIALDACVLNSVVHDDEPIQVVIALRNRSGSNVVIRPSFVLGAWLNAVVVDPRGDTVTSTIHVEPAATELVVLSPGVFVGSTVDLRCAGGATSDDSRPEPPCAMPFEMQEAGEYTVTMTYTVMCEEGVPCSIDPPRETLFARPFRVTVSGR